MRIASLLPAATDIAYALGLDDELVAVTFECTVPTERRPHVEVIVGARDTSDMAPAEIDAYVRSRAAADADLYTLHADALARAAPDLVLTQDLCRVCAIDEGRVDEALRHLGCVAAVVSLDPHSLAEILDAIVAVGAHAGVRDRADALVEALAARLSEVADRVAGRRRRRVAVIEWVEPVFGAGHWIPDLVVAAGGTAVAGHPHERSVPTTWQAIAAAAPDVAIVAPCGFGLDGASEQARLVAERLPDTEVWAIDADALVVRPGPGVVAGVEAIASVLHPTAMPAMPDRVRRVEALGSVVAGE